MIQTLSTLSFNVNRQHLGRHLCVVAHAGSGLARLRVVLPGFDDEPVPAAAAHPGSAG
jgi:hypothetical protein